MASPPPGRPAGILARYTSLAHAPDDTDDERLQKTVNVLLTTLVLALTPAWILTYLALDRPLSAAIPASYAVVSVIGLVFVFRTKRARPFYAGEFLAMLALPILLQWTLGGFVLGSAVILWSTNAPLMALVTYGQRAALIAFGAFMAAVVISGFLEAGLAAQFEPLPLPVQTTFFVLNVVAPAATAIAALVYFVRQRDEAMDRSEQLLLNILPAPIARRLKADGEPIADKHDAVTVVFMDIVGFTAFAERTPPEELVDLLGRIFGELDELAEAHGLDKIKTLGDGYLAAAGLRGDGDRSVANAAAAALEAESLARAAVVERWPDFRLRVGLATGPLVAGVIGRRRFSYDLWGDTVNTASRMTSLAEPGWVVVTAATADRLRQAYRVDPLPPADVKGKGRIAAFRLLPSGVAA